MNFLTAAANPAGGAATQDIVLATGGAMILTTFVVVLGVLYRSGKVGWLHKLADFSERQWGVPSWVALSGEIASVALIIALLGMYWDISLHIDQGRDPGPLANPAHYLILFGLFGIFAAGWLSIVLTKREARVPTGIAITRDWWAPMGAVLMCACGAFSLVGFPLDDVWHRLFGQDVTLWGPTHLMLIGGAAMTLIGLAVLLVEAGDASREGGHRGEVAWVTWMRRVSLPGAFLLGL